MKVEQEQPEKVFYPITITLETEHEAKLMWAALNSSDSTIAKNAKDYDLDSFDIAPLWGPFDKVYRPTCKY